MLVSIVCEYCLHIIVVFVVQHITVHLYDFMIKYVCLVLTQLCSFLMFFHPAIHY